MKLKDKIKKDKSVSLNYDRIRNKAIEVIEFKEKPKKYSFNSYIKFSTICIVVLLIGIFSYVFVDNAISQGKGSTNSYNDYVACEADEKKDVQYQDYMDSEYLEFLEKLNIFSNKISEAVYKQYASPIDNYAISPVSIYMALAMCVECSSSETREEILNALGMSYEEVKKHTSTLYSLLNDKETDKNDIGEEVEFFKKMITNSIWVDKNAVLKENCLLSLAKDYNCSSYSVPFNNNNKKANKAIRDYIYDKTFGLIDNDFDLSDETIFALINTFYVKDTWNTDGKDLDFTKDKYNFNNEKLIQLMKSDYSLGKIYETDKLTHYYASTANGIKIKFLIPKEGYELNDIYNIENLNEIHAIKSYNGRDDINKIEYHTRTLFPEFEVDFNEDIALQLKNDLNIKKLFTEDCDFSNISDDEIYCESVVHSTKLKVTKKGIEGAAVTIVEAYPESPGGEYEPVYQEFIVDKSFAYVITDNRNITLFTGVVNKI